MSRHITRLDPPTGPLTLDHPRPDRLVSGNPARHTWTHYEAPQGDLSVGEWRCEVGAWRIAFPPGKDEVFFVLEGHVRLHDAAGGHTDVGPGQSAVIPGGFEGVFEVLSPVRKHFVVLDRAAAG